MSFDYENAVVVITGASGGIGKATAQALAIRGATVVLASRNKDALERTLASCERLGGRGIVVPTDVSVAEQVDALADKTVDTYDRMDGWVNNAAVSMFGRLEEAPRAEYERVLHTNLIGCVNGSRAAIRQFREQGRGRLVNVSSVVGYVGQPYTSAYVTSKWGIRGLSECLRMELADAPEISVSTVLPASIDTPLFQNAANHTGRQVQAMPPVYPPEHVAMEIVRQMSRPRREVVVGNAGRAIAMMSRLSPGLSERMMRRQVESGHFQDEYGVPGHPGNLFDEQSTTNHVRGGWIAKQRREQAPKRRLKRAGAMAAACALALPVLALAARRAR